METISLMNYVKPICLSIIAIGVVIILVKRATGRTVTYREIQDWAEGVCKQGDICHMSILSNMPREVKDSVRKQNGIKQVVNGYNENTSIFVTITDSDNNIKETCYFMGKSLDKELTQALSTEVVHRIIF